MSRNKSPGFPINAKNRYYGAFVGDTGDDLVGFIKIGRPLVGKAAYSGRETNVRRALRKISFGWVTPPVVSPDTFEILEMDVRPDMSHQGIGTSLVHVGVWPLRESSELRLNVPSISGESEDAQFPAAAFFERLGFTSLEKYTRYPDAEHGPLDALWMDSLCGYVKFETAGLVQRAD